MRKSLIAIGLGLFVLLMPLWVASEQTAEKRENSTPGYIVVEDVVWKEAQGKPNHPQRGLFSLYIPQHSLVIEPGPAGSSVRHDLFPGRYEAVAYSSRGKFNVELTLRDHSPYHAGVVSNTYYVDYFSFEVESEKVTVIQGYIGPYKTKDLPEMDREDSGGYTAYWEPRVKIIEKRAIRMEESK